MRIIWTRQAAASLNGEKAYIAASNPAAASSVAGRIIDSVERLAVHPESGRPGRVPGTRELVVTGTPYIVPYVVREDAVLILRVFHAARKWPTGFTK
ncbi:MAG: type II toxin-antitoxin system RelE/ParE family toxin [Alphaproteobacteria bacterium]|nr:MAG: type II toxin-antitoxin system RelE/ParE family toxin [Alphaproteobacteria bacterium]